MNKRERLNVRREFFPFDGGLASVVELAEYPCLQVIERRVVFGQFDACMLLG